MIIRIIISVIIVFASLSSYAKKCTGRMINPVSDICWECMMPITIGDVPIVPGEKPDIKNPSEPICKCPGKIAGVPQIGISIGLWEGVRLTDITKSSYCFVNLGGKKIGDGLVPVGEGSDPDVSDDQSSAVWHSHLYVYPVGLLLQSIIDAVCLEISTFDVAWISEVDSLWNDDMMTFLIAPESILFTNPIAHAVCAADCIASTARTAFDALFWCSGCQGTHYPMNGRIQHHKTSLQSALLANSRTLYRLHRQLQLPVTSGKLAQCQPYPAPIIKKSQYRTQMINPIPANNQFFGCQPLGKSTIFYEMGREFPIKGEDFGFLNWRKRNCCML